jgi:hypothetical protein
MRKKRPRDWREAGLPRASRDQAATSGDALIRLSDGHFEFLNRLSRQQINASVYEASTADPTATTVGCA